jgi:hypothetical protein
MKRKAWLATISASILTGALVTTAVAAPPIPTGATQAKEAASKSKKAGLPFPAPAGLKFGLSPSELSKFYSKVWDKRYLKLFKKADPTQQQALEYELRDKKRLINRNVIAFGKLPTGIDQSPLKGEYSYLNGESMTRFTEKSGTRRNFFFFKSRGLWKVYDEYKLRAGGPLGTSFEEAVGVLAKKFDKKPKVLAADFEKGRAFETAEWSDSRIIIRAVNRDYQKVLGLVYVDKETEVDLDKLRTHKPAAEGLSKEVKAATRKKKEDDKAKGKARKKKK